MNDKELEVNVPGEAEENKQEKLNQLKQEYFDLQSQCFNKLIKAVRIMADTQAAIVRRTSK